LDEEESGLIGNRRTSGKYKDNADTIEMTPMLPSMFDISTELDINLSMIKNEINELNSVYKKLIIASTSDKKQIENSLDNLNYKILKDFEQCYVLIKKFEYLQKNHRKLNLHYTENDVEILVNFKKAYAKRILDSSLTFRNLQNNYIKFLRDDEDEFDSLLPSNPALQEEDEKSAAMNSNIEAYSNQIIQQVQSTNSSLLQQRDKEISQIAMGILEILTIFKEMESLVVDQGTMLDRIDYNLQNTVQDLKQSDKELIKAKDYQKRTTKCKIIFLLSLIVFALVILLLFKPHGSTKVIEKPAPQPQPQPDSRPEIDIPNGAGMV
jgi:syntaxin 16